MWNNNLLCLKWNTLYISYACFCVSTVMPSNCAALNQWKGAAFVGLLSYDLTELRAGVRFSIVHLVATPLFVFTLRIINLMVQIYVYINIVCGFNHCKINVFSQIVYWSLIHDQRHPVNRYLHKKWWHRRDIIYFWVRFCSTYLLI